jgi:hypothetical protein
VLDLMLHSRRSAAPAVSADPRGALSMRLIDDVFSPL